MTSELRQVPDTQEIFLSPESDVSVVFEVLESVEPVDPQGAAKFHFDSLAHDNDAVPDSCVVDQVITPTSTEPINPLVLSVLHGTQLVPKFNLILPDTIKIFLAIYRVHEKNIDITMVLNIPVETQNEGGAVELGGEKYKAWLSSFDVAVSSFKIVNYGLFA
ncbi:Ran guanine nucleotide release factor [Ceratobasidium sp. AG-Ba]|nr:Ran guanine nucleotide release factor [Ceratobasidium sp. AG-Ba]